MESASRHRLLDSLKQRQAVADIEEDDNRMEAQARSILIVDDDEKARWISERIMKKAGYQVFTAINGEDGLQKARDLLPDLIILDVMMPKLNGYEVFQYLKSSSITENIKVVMLTAKGDRNEINAEGKAVIAGFEVDGFLTKPVPVQELIACVQMLV
jgi:DNA-binding response OmpR family regulator